MRYLIYTRRYGEQGEECCYVYGEYEIVESEDVPSAISAWWDVVTGRAKEVYDFHKDEWELRQPIGKNGRYSIKHKIGWRVYDIIIIPLRRRGDNRAQMLDLLDTSRGGSLDDILKEIGRFSK